MSEQVSISVHDFYGMACVAKPKQGPFAGKFMIADAEWFSGQKTDAQTAFRPFVGWNVEGTDPRIENILRTSFAMYQTFSNHYGAMQALLAYLDGMKIGERDPIRVAVEDLCNSTLLIQQAAREGLDEVAQQIIKERANRG